MQNLKNKALERAATATKREENIEYDAKTRAPRSKTKTTAPSADPLALEEGYETFDRRCYRKTRAAPPMCGGYPRETFLLDAHPRIEKNILGTSRAEKV